MLQTNMLQLDSSPHEDAAEDGAAQLLDRALRFLRNQWLVIIIATVFAFAASVVFLKIAPPSYTAQARLLFVNPKGPILQQQSVLADAAGDLESQIEILKSRGVVTSVINELNLADDPELNGKDHWLHSVWKDIRKTMDGGTRGRKIDPLDELIAEFESRLSALRIGSSAVIEVSFTSSNAVRAAEIANAIAGAYIDDQLRAKAEASRTATTWLHDRLQELGHDALTAERAVNKLKSESNVVTAGGRLVDEQQVVELNSRLVNARAQTSEASARLSRLEAALAPNSADRIPIGKIDALALEALGNPIITGLRQQYLDSARREHTYSARYGRDHLAVVNLRTTMKGIHTSILEEARRIAEISKSEFEVAKLRQQEIEKQLALSISQSQNTSSAELSTRELETSAKGYRSLYEALLGRYVGSLQQESFPISEARVISPAAPPQSKSKPKTKSVLALGILGGIGLGLGLGLFREIADRSFRTSAQLEATLRLPCLSLVPLLRDHELKKLTAKKAAQSGNKFAKNMLSRRCGMYWAAMDMPSSRFAESIRSIRLAIDQDPTKNSKNIIGITSALPNEGKSTIAASLAQLLANSGKRVIIVDCDLRNPALSTNLAPDADVGIIDVLFGARCLEDAVWTDSETSLALLPAAKRAPLPNTSEIMCTEQTQKLFDKLRATYDYVIVDLPPLAPIVDVRAITPLIDRFILVVEWGRTSTDVVRHALHAAPNLCEALVGAVLNKTVMKAMKRYASHYGDYYSDEHYIRYGRLAAE